MRQDEVHGVSQPVGELDSRVLGELRRSYNPPPRPPLEEMWAKVEEGSVRTSGERPETDNVFSIAKSDVRRVPGRAASQLLPAEAHHRKEARKKRS
jgi:hypothetical protein